MDTAPPFALYNPALLPPDVLLSEFTARRPLLARLLDIIRANDPGEPAQHVLCVGPRGMGKTTLLCAIAATIKLHEPELAKHWQPVIFDEESRRIGDLADFWLECIRQWEAETEPTLTRSHRIDALLAKPGPDIEDKAREVFLSLVDASGKRALLLIDNLNDIFIAVNDAESLMRLRSFLMSDPRVMIIGAATRWFSDVTGLDKPFFEFFRPFDLHALSLEEMRECLAGVATARGDQRVLDTLRDRPGSIEVLHILTGGNPRLIRTFYRLLNEGMNGELRLQLERLIDDYTPYHKAIIDALPGQQQRVLDAIALEWNPTDVGTVARTTRLPSNQVSAQIKALIKVGLISEAANMGHSKKKAYLLTDRFSNIHYLMRHGRTGKLKMHWYVMMLRALFGDNEFAEVAAKTIRMTSTAGLRDDGLLIAQSVIECAGSENARRMFLDLMTGGKGYDREVTDLELAEKLCRSTIAQNPRDAYGHYKLGRLLEVRLRRFQDAEASYLHSIAIDSKFAAAWNGLGGLNRRKDAGIAFENAIEHDPKLGDAWANLGMATLLSNEPQKAVDIFKKGTVVAPSCSGIWHNLGIALAMWLNKAEEGVAACRKATELEPDSARAWNGLGILLDAYCKQPLEAESAYRRAITLAYQPDEKAAYLSNLATVLARSPDRQVEVEDALRTIADLVPTSGEAVAALADFFAKDNRPREARITAARSVMIEPTSHKAQSSFKEFCFDDRTALHDTLMKLSKWCAQHPNQSVLSFMVDAWIAYAKVTSASEARELLDAQPDEVKLAFETVRDAFLAHEDKDHLHRLAPERRAPVLKLLERF